MYNENADLSLIQLNDVGLSFMKHCEDVAKGDKVEDNSWGVSVHGVCSAFLHALTRCLAGCNEILRPEHGIGWHVTREDSKVVTRGDSEFINMSFLYKVRM